MLCAHCGQESPAKTTRRRFCSPKWRAAAWQRKREEREARLRERVKALAKELGLTAEDLEERTAGRKELARQGGQNS